MKKLVTITFEPEGRRVRTTPGVTIFQVASEAGVGIRSECGGEGTCGKCRVLIQDINAVTPATKADREHLSPPEISSGYRLACRTILKQDVMVFIPKESRVGVRKIQITGMERPVPLNPLVRKFRLVLPKPTLSDARPDLERLLDGVQDTFSLNNLEVDYDLSKGLPGLLRDADWDVTVTVWNNRRIIAVEKGDTSKKLFGLAVDIGTSKIVGYVVDLTNGKTVGVGSIENPQVRYGEDIMSRITFAMKGDENLEVLQRLVVKAINDIIHETCAEASVDPNCIYEATVVGNTAMHHFFLAIQPEHVAFSPYTPAVRRSMDIRGKELNVKMCPTGIVHVLPIIAGFVGADAVGDILSSGIHEAEELSLLLDIGTNTEVFVGNLEDILCCSCASGPAFEGAHIKHGMKAGTGAIERVRIDQDSYEVEYETIDGAKPVGLSGSAMVDIVAEMLRGGIIDRRGRFNRGVKTRRLREVYGNIEFVLAWEDETGTGKEVTVTQGDIREIQLAKAAISTGCSILIKRKKVRNGDLDRVFIAGAFGSYITPENAKFIGLVPDVPAETIRLAGNTAITGAKMALISRGSMETAETLSKRVRYLELATDPDFHQEFTNALYFPHKDLDRFPSVKEYFRKLEGNVQV